ncbi:Inositol-pentakisphosphate 2-kinase [Exophiala dermatitidis]|uniref:Inositol-pentakisphosphate 2-kinase n=2 Tax=Exophiala dermatitidis TaxID=5970 RepID=H6C875_EXODN|nr:uncharacterized protein HMPREF1120_08269 [Exophiala dermatitidis NIH/UT8656]KAJ4523417.1 Inositol-pentakisphosphate 2-kinase [Exophiala dermatitidis]EHY60302.1 hypothetical protein HMPREF1120_08269 [Exophiala dermatitidis NIH/UT8656]KAJ4524468.1 Inositol-pentakisphosphate 2-kinase [Exophiala dermatitidis]KAJ4527313.1 Inositol-pentakisphosphate 2-kinase [Exophiala dermatitidis]KAJ4530867.1 Inositol-pentakisphosphate 2-kinase [Exophiala dermatitidis]
MQLEPHPQAKNGSDLWSDRLKALSHAELQLHYLAEGAANIIYSVSVPVPSAATAELDLQEIARLCVLRLRKDLPSTKPAVEVMRDFEERITPLFSGHEGLLLKQTLYGLTPKMVESANAELRQMEKMAEDSSSSTSSTNKTEIANATRPQPRPRHRHHVCLPPYEKEQYGILMQNLKAPTDDSGVDHVELVEFKPKWLVQSPSAPQDATMCRTCALNAMRRKAGKHQGRGDSGFCPFDLLAGSEENHVLQRALEKIYPETTKDFVAAFRQRVQPALKHLAKLQREYGSVGLDDFRDPNPQGKHLDLAMALRDCSVFLGLRRGGRGDAGPNEDPSSTHLQLGDEQRAADGHETHDVVELVDVKFADLDLKTPEAGKLQKWAAMEQELLDNGWYYCDSQSEGEGSNCALSRHRPKRSSS